MSSTVLRYFAAAALTGIASAASAQLSPNQTAISNALAGVTVPSPATTALQTSLAGLAPADQSAAYSQLSPGSYALLPDLTLRTADFEEGTIRRYLRDFRAGGTGVPGKAGEAAPGSRVFGSFLVGSGKFGHYDANSDRDRNQFGQQSVMGGIDLRAGPKSLFGVTGGYTNIDTGLDQYSRKSAIRSWFGGGYTTLGVGPLYLDLYGTYGEANYDLRRSVNFGGNTVTPTSLGFETGTKSRTWLGGGTVGLSFNEFGFEFEPFAGARYANLRINGFTDGADAGAISLGRSTYTSVLGTAGLRVGAAVDIGGGVSLRPEVRGAYKHEFEHYGSRGFNFGFGGPAASTVAFQSTPLARDYYTAGGGLTLSSANSPFSIVLDYDGEFARDREVHGVTGGFRLTF